MNTDQIVTALATISDRLARIETKLDAHAIGHLDHEARLRALEKARWIAVGAAAVTGGLAGKVAGLL